MDYSPDDPATIAAYAQQLEGMTFRDVLDLGIVAEGVSREYGSKRYKGGLGTLLEERFFGYKEARHNVDSPDRADRSQII